MNYIFRNFVKQLIISKLGNKAMVSHRLKVTIDNSKYPKLNENDIEEQFVKGSGPGGQFVNKTSNCVVLKHKVTGFVIKCHSHRLLSLNRKEARRLLLVKLDNHLNGSNSIENQQKQIELKKMNERQRRNNKLQEMKKNWLLRESKPSTDET